MTAATRTDACDWLLRHARIVSMDADDDYGLIEDGAIACTAGRIEYLGPDSDLPPTPRRSRVREYNCAGALITPGLIDCHTHAVFAGNRSREFEQRLEGVSYADIAREGGGIRATVAATRACDDEGLIAASLPRVHALMSDGVTTLEIKSGYGLDLTSERRMLRVARAIGERLGIRVSTTFLGAHAMPPEFEGRADAYVDACCEWLRILSEEGLVDAVDAFCESIGFTIAQTRRVFECARSLGLPVKLHADQLSNGEGAALVAEFGGLSADHVEYTGARAVAAMASAGTVAVLLPGAYLCLRETQQPPIEAFRSAGVAMAVATDLNPGTSPLLSLRLAMALACAQFRLTPLEALQGTTRHAARALGLENGGVLREGARADLAVWDAREPADLCYWLGGPMARTVIAEGRKVAGEWPQSGG